MSNTNKFFKKYLKNVDIVSGDQFDLNNYTDVFSKDVIDGIKPILANTKVNEIFIVVDTTVGSCFSIFKPNSTSSLFQFIEEPKKFLNYFMNGVLYSADEYLSYHDMNLIHMGDLRNFVLYFSNVVNKIDNDSNNVMDDILENINSKLEKINKDDIISTIKDNFSGDINIVEVSKKLSKKLSKTLADKFKNKNKNKNENENIQETVSKDQTKQTKQRVHLDEKQKSRAYVLWKEGTSIDQLATMFNVAKITISRLIKNKTLIEDTPSTIVQQREFKIKRSKK